MIMGTRNTIVVTKTATKMKVFVLLLLFFRCYESTDSVEDYYWRDYKGLVPQDAIPNDGSTSYDRITDETTYIGQFTVVSEYNQDVADLHTIVATINRGQKRAIAAYNGRTVYSNETSNLKVLCGKNLYSYSWRDPRSLFSSNCRFVIGGYEDNIPLYIGKATKGKQVLVGKVFSDTSFHVEKLMAPYQGGEEKFDGYQLLTYCY
ncbi:hypothetical protein FQA39_LY03038 [Lamprigera yunnana]|nr:hypothetical protein FQA39_LY03038 [Lamprigera yunnana]